MEGVVSGLIWMMKYPGDAMDVLGVAMDIARESIRVPRGIE